MCLMTYERWAKRGYPKLKVAFHGHEFACIYVTDKENPEGSMRLQTNVGDVGDPTDIRPIKWYKGEYAREIADELGLFRARDYGDTGKASTPTKLKSKKKVRPEPDPFEDLHST